MSDAEFPDAELDGSVSRSNVAETPRLTIPDPVLEVVFALSKIGGPAWLVGKALAESLQGQTPNVFQICAATPMESLLAHFPHAVPTRPAEALVMIPTAAGPVDVSAPCQGKDMLADLGRRCFTIHAMAWDPVRDEWLDPFGGQADARSKRLRTVGDPAARLAEDRIRALVATRLAAELDYQLDPALAAELRGVLSPLTPALRLRIRRELTPLLLSPGAGRGIDLLRSTGLEEVLVPGARADSGAVVTRLPSDLALRLAAWLRDSNPARVLATLRFGRDLGIRVQRLLRHHPIDAPGAAGRTLERALRRLDDEDVAALFLLRRAEIAAALSQSQELNGTVSPLSRVQQDPARLDRLEQRLWAARRAATAARSAGRLALRGEQIMKLLGCGPGPQIGAALRYLSECVAEDPACNTEASLRVRLDAWSRPNREPGAK